MSTRSIILFITLATLIMGCSPGGDRTKKEGDGVVSGDLPDIVLLPEEGEKYSATTLPGQTIMIFFAPDCDHCQREAQQIREKFDAFKKYNLYFISMDSFNAMHQFARDYRLDHMATVHFMRADGVSVLKALGDVTTPTICVYGTDRKLKKRFDGETPIADIIAAL